MTDHDDSLVGLSLDTAVDTVVARTGDEPDTVRAALGRVTTDGIVRREAVDDAALPLVSELRPDDGDGHSDAWLWGTR